MQLFSLTCKPELSYATGAVVSSECMPSLGYYVRPHVILTHVFIRFKRWNELPEKVDDALAELIPATTEKLTTKERRQHALSTEKMAERTRFHVKSALALNEEYKSIRGGKHKAAWLELQRALSQENDIHEGNYSGYLDHLGDIQDDRAQKANGRRREQIKQNLIDLGWGDEMAAQGHELAIFNELRWSHHMDACDELTPEEWDSIKADLATLMHRSQRNRIIRQKAARIRQGLDASLQPAYSAWVVSQLPNSIVPSLGELVLTEDFLPIVEMASLNEDVPNEMIQGAIAQIPKLAVGWRNTIDDFLLDLVRQSSAYAGTEISKEVLSYATTLFVCLTCGNPVTYPSLIVHHCLRKNRRTMFYSQEEKVSKKKKAAGVDLVTLSPPQNGPDISIVDLAHGSFYPRIWQPLSSEEPMLQFHTSGYYHTVSILKMRGMELTTSMERMLDLNPDAVETRREAKSDPLIHVIGSLYLPGRRPDYSLRLLRQIRPEDFKRVYFYGSFVRKLHGNSAPQALVEELCRHVRGSGPQKPLFPKLKALTIDAGEFAGEAKLPRLLMGSGAHCLETVCIDYGSYDPAHDYRSMWTNMSTFFQPSQTSIRTFEIEAWDSLREHGQLAIKSFTSHYCKFVEKLKNLTSLELDGIAIDRQFFRHVATLMQLESLGFWPSRVDMSVLEESNKDKYFPSLRTLALYTNDYSSIVGLQNYFKDAPLKTLKHVQHGSGSSAGFTDYIQSFQVGRWCETVTAIGLIVFPTIYDAELATQDLLMVNSIPEGLGGFKELQRIRINPAGVDPSDPQFFARAAKAFPRLNKLDIGNDLIDPMELPPFSYFLAHLSDIPHIDQFAVVVDARKLPSEQEQKRLKPHPNLRVIGKPHLILRRVFSSDDSSDDEEDSGVVRFSLFAQKRIDVKPGKEILLCVATEDGAFKDVPLVFEGSAVPEISHEEPSKEQDAMEVDKKDEKAEDDEEEDPLASPVRQTMPPKMRRTWQKKVEDPKPVSDPTPIRISVGIQAEPEVVSTAVEAIPETRSVSIEAAPTTSSASTQVECFTSAVSVQASPDVECAGTQTTDVEPQDRRSLSPMELDSATNSAASSPTTSYFPASLSTTQTSLPDRSVSPVQKDGDERSTSQDLAHDSGWGVGSPPMSPSLHSMFPSDFIQTSASATSLGGSAAHLSSALDNREALPTLHALYIAPQNSSSVPPVSLPTPTAPPLPRHHSGDLYNHSQTNQEAPASASSQPKVQRDPDGPKPSTSSAVPKAKRPGIYDLFVPAKMATGPGSALDIIPSGVITTAIEQPKESKEPATQGSNQVQLGTQSGPHTPNPVPEASSSRTRLDSAPPVALPAKPVPPKFLIDLTKSDTTTPLPSIDPSQVARPGAGPVGNPLNIRPSTMPAALRNNITSKVPPAGPRSLATMASKKPVVIGSGWSASKGAQGIAISTEQSSAKKQKRTVQTGVTEFNGTNQPAESTAGATSEPSSTTEVTPAPPPSLPPPPPPPPTQDSSSGSRWKPVAIQDSASGPAQGVQSKVESSNVNGPINTQNYTYTPTRASAFA
ncbi:hypothetical protein EST38_g3141 [Candolleomyces aberdarensis]|uniref:Uncharacterized protein n=1 Tax=Candolleomyces aberdarensis TaxID=2316362 RepID=A0A4V1Q4N6_9AGAR|nr:hypothetical protein EST38_g3141 [Candolleomyces aberdarensis]